jgi:hypothetical protein
MIRGQLFHQGIARFQMETDIAWWSTAALFLIGWGLGLLGKLYDVPEAATGE